jgi:sulfur carrier protein
MQLLINNVLKNFESEIVSVAVLLEAESILDSRGIAIAVNQNVIPKKEWDNFPLKDKDSVLIIKAAQGG